MRKERETGREEECGGKMSGSTMKDCEKRSERCRRRMSGRERKETKKRGGEETTLRFLKKWIVKGN